MKIKSTLSRNLAFIFILIVASSNTWSQSISILKQKYNKQEVYITMRDGVRLFTSIYTPKNTSVAHPILMNRTPYNIEPGGPDSFNYFMQLYERYTSDDYIMVYQDVRGSYMSEGEYEDIRPVIPLRKSNKDTDESTFTANSSPKKSRAGPRWKRFFRRPKSSASSASARASPGLIASASGRAIPKPWPSGKTPAA